jgi:bacterioferritin
MSANINSPEQDRMYPFLSEIAEIRRRARRHILAGSTSAVASSEPAVSTVITLLNEALATELICVARYRRRAAMSGEPLVEALRVEFQKYAQEEQGHADQLAARITQLGGQPNTEPLPVHDPVDLEHLDVDTIADMLEEDLIAERIAIDSYREILTYLGSGDSNTRELLDAILRVEIAHAGELSARRAEALRRERIASGATSSRLPALELH